MRLVRFLRSASALILKTTVMVTVAAVSIRPSPPTVQSNGLGARIAPEQAIALALNRLQKTAAGWQVSHPHHIIEFLSDGVRVTPQNSRMDWSWQLTWVGSTDRALANVRVSASEPNNDQPGRITYARGAISEQYIIRQNTVEQQFIISDPLPLSNADLVIAGRVTSAGEFEVDAASEWVWRTDESGVRLGNVRVYDAAGRELSARMSVTAISTRIHVDGIALAQAVYPVTIDPEIGTDDFRISDMGADGDATRDALNPAVAYNSTNNEYFVVWSGDEGNDDEFEIRGQRLNAATGAPVGTNDIVLSSMGPSANISYTADAPAIAYNSLNNEYLVVWSGDDNTAPLVEGEFEIFGQRVDAATGNGVGNNDFRLSDMGPNGNNGYDALSPAVAYNSARNEYVVVWHGDDDTGTLVGQEFEIYGQRINGDRTQGDEIGVDMRLSDMGPDGVATYDALNAAIAYNGNQNQYLVVWWGDDDTGTLIEGELEIFGQLLTASGAELAGDTRLSNMGPNGNVDYAARVPAIASNDSDKEFLVVWQGTAGFDTLNNPHYEIFGQRVNAATGLGVGANDFQISTMFGSITNPGDALNPTVSYNISSNDYLIAWEGISHIHQTVDHGYEIYAQRLTAAGAEVGYNVRLSQMGPLGTTTYQAFTPDIAYDSADNEFVAVWSGDDNTGALVDEEHEIYGQRYTVIESLFLPLVTRNYPPCETEPNDAGAQANPVNSSQSYCGYYNSGALDGDRDFFTFVLTSTGSITIDLTNVVAGQQVQLSLFYQGTGSGNQVGFVAGPPFGTSYQIVCPSPSCPGAAGQYYIRVFMPVGYSPTAPYTLVATYP